ncbi:MAG: polyprenyl synthetase family protein [Chloroflexota bacterium]|nr:polyprenyl synthetase family protein [Chloroflexota bacterium]
MSIASIYAPIQEDLAQVEESIKAFCRADEYPLMAELLSYVLVNGGKRIRPALALLAAKYHRYDLEKLIPLATGIEVFHNATLVHDDSIDKSDVRRGKDSVVKYRGEEVALLLGDYLFAGSGDLVCRSGSLRVTELFARTIMKICSGQLKEFMGAFNWQRGLDDYYEQIDSKTATLFATSAEGGAILSEAPEDAVRALSSYGRNLGMAFQVIDDILDFVGDEKDLGKPAGSDLLQGTVTLPAILFASKYPQDSPLERVFARQGDREEVARFIERVRDSSVIQQCYDVAADFSARARSVVDSLPDSVSRRSLLDLADYVVDRRR